jgi:transketolase
MRNAFAAEITELAMHDPRIVLLSGDIGNRLFDRLKEQCPGRFFNCGVAEANMIGVAAGMGLCGLRPVAYTIAPFLTARCLEQIRLDICYQRVPVVLVATGAGLSYASLNATHHSCEDLAWLRVLPNMTVLCPGDPVEVRLALRAAMRHDGPVYVRIGKKGEPVVHEREPVFEIGRWIPLRPGGDVQILSTGNVLPLAVAIADSLTQTGILCGAVSCPSVKPLDLSLLGKVFAESRLVVTLEEHSKLGGFGGAVAEWLSEQATPRAKLLRQGTEDRFLYEAAEQEHARHLYGLTTEAVSHAIQKALAGQR